MPKITECPVGWYALRCQIKREHIAVAHIRSQVPDMQAYCPRISYVKTTSSGKRRFKEALFPAYLFVHGDISQHYRHLMAINGITGLVSYGDEVPRIPAAFIGDIQAQLGEEVDVPEEEFQPGMEVRLTEGPFINLQAIVTGELSGQERVKLLVEFLGTQVEVTVSKGSVVKKDYQASPKERVWKA